MDEAARAKPSSAKAKEAADAGLMVVGGAVGSADGASDGDAKGGSVGDSVGDLRQAHSKRLETSQNRFTTCGLHRPIQTLPK